MQLGRVLPPRRAGSRGLEARSCHACQAWTLRQISASPHAVSTQMQQGGRPVTLSFYRDQDGVVWLRLWSDPDTSAVLSQMHASLRSIDVLPYAGAWLLSSEWPGLVREHVRVGRLDRRAWMDLRLGLIPPDGFPMPRGSRSILVMAAGRDARPTSPLSISTWKAGRRLFGLPSAPRFFGDICGTVIRSVLLGRAWRARLMR